MDMSFLDQQLIIDGRTIVGVVLGVLGNGVFLRIPFRTHRSFGRAVLMYVIGSLLLGASMYLFSSSVWVFVIIAGGFFVAALLTDLLVRLVFPTISASLKSVRKRFLSSYRPSPKT